MLEVVRDASTGHDNIHTQYCNVWTVDLFSAKYNGEGYIAIYMMFLSPPPHTEICMENPDSSVKSNC